VEGTTVRQVEDRPVWKVGELARLAGLTVRTLHHWDEIGLMTPSARTASGHRLYDEADVRRLYEVVALRELGLPLESISMVLRGGPDPLGEVLGQHLARVDAQMAALRSLRARLATLVASVRTVTPPTTSDLLKLIDEVSKMTETFRNYFTPEQMAALEARRQRLGEDYIAGVGAEWPQLMAKVQADMDAGTEPAEPRVQALASRWMELLEAFDGGDPELREANFRMRAENAEEVERAGGPSEAMIRYITWANQARRS
jgi:DNA-binding transcriptional MerR regulator